MLINSIDANECVIEFVDEAVELDIVLLVFTMVFDLVCYRRLKIKLHATGVVSVATSWMTFLTNRKQEVKVHGHGSQSFISETPTVLSRSSKRCCTWTNIIQYLH